jgi:two-component system, OmpR family, sensor kinase
VSRLSLRLRLTLVFAVVIALVLTVTGLAIYNTFRADLNSAEDRALRSRSEEVTALVEQANLGIVPSLAHVSSAEDDFAQVLRPNGRLLAATPQVPSRPVLEGENLRRAATGQVFAERGPIEQLDGRVRVQAVPVASPLGSVIVVVGTALGERDHELNTLALLLIAGGGVALMLASLAGYGVAAAALRPVEAMRRRATSILPGEPARRLPVARSGDEIARLGTTLNEMLDRLQAAFVRERVFVADASHELRTPLAILKTEIELALKEGRSIEELRGALESAAEETDRLARLAEDLLVIARLDQGRVPIRAGDIDSQELLAHVAERMKGRARREGVSVVVSDARHLHVSGDRPRVEQALENMLDNALRYAREEVRLSAVARDAVIELHVRDDGPGFEPAVIDRAFERFVRGGSARSRGGSGLGLAIVAAIAQSHGGNVHAANRSGGGADVWLELPAGPAAHSLPPALTAA